MRGVRAARLFAALTVWGLLSGWNWTAAAASLPRGLHQESEGQRYWVSRFALEYAEPHPSAPSLELVAAKSFALGQARDGYVGPRRGGRNHWFRLDGMGAQEPVPIYASGLRELAEQIVADLNARGLVGVYVAPHPDDIEPQTGADRRPGDTSVLRLRIHTGRVKAVRTFAADAALDNTERVDRPEHRAIAARSPVRTAERAGASGDLLDRKRLDEYVARLNRYPGRVVDVVLTPTLEPGRINVDYIVEEERPWSFYSGVSDTGTERTDRWRQRFGLEHQQLFGLDDALRLDYVTDGFDDIHAIFGSYSGLLPGVSSGSRLEGTRWRLGAARTEYSSVVGLGLVGGGGVSTGRTTDEEFSGETSQLELGLEQTVYQSGSLFVDLGAGLRWSDIEVENLDGPGTSMPFVVPGLTLQLESLGLAASRYARFSLEKSMPGLAGTSSSDLEDFEIEGGRMNLDDDWLALRWEAGLRFHPGPWLRARRFGSFRPSGMRDLRHEIELSTQGQYAFDNRVIPHEQAVLGGVYSVRGYPQSVVAGDSMYMLRAEYRYHWPLALAPRPPLHLPLLGEFHLGPASALARPDWDLIFKTFFDFGGVVSHDALEGEEDETLASVGVGLEMIVRRNLSVRLDHGIALTEVDDGVTEAGDSETHITAVVRY